MPEDPFAVIRARGDDLLSEFRVNAERLRAALEKSAAGLERIGDQADRHKDRPTLTPVEKKIQGGELTWEDVLLRQSEDPAVQGAQRSLAPHLRLLHQAMFEACDLKRPIDEALAQMDAEVIRLEREKRQMNESERSGNGDRKTNEQSSRPH